MSMLEIITALNAKPGVELELRTRPPSKALGDYIPGTMQDGIFVPNPRRVFEAPSEITEFRELVKSAGFFGESGQDGPAHSGWKIKNTELWLYRTPNDLLFGGSEDGCEYFEKCFAFAESLAGGPDYLAVDLHKDRYGWIILTWPEFGWENAAYPVIARSFKEWLGKTVAAGPDVRYWEQKEFVDIGPAIPGHPNYRPPNYDALKGE